MVKENYKELTIIVTLISSYFLGYFLAYLSSNKEVKKLKNEWLLKKNQEEYLRKKLKDTINKYKNGDKND